MRTFLMVAFFRVITGGCPSASPGQDRPIVLPPQSTVLFSNTAPALHSLLPTDVPELDATDDFDELVATLLLLELVDDTPVPLDGIEHSFTVLLGAGSEPKVATLQL